MGVRKRLNYIAGAVVISASMLAYACEEPEESQRKNIDEEALLAIASYNIAAEENDPVRGQAAEADIQKLCQMFTEKPAAYSIRQSVAEKIEDIALQD